MAVPSLSEAILQPQIIESYLNTAQHLPMKERLRWFHEEAARRGCNVTRVRRIVSSYVEHQAFDIENERFSKSQKIAMELGASQSKAIQVLNKGMNATRKKSYTVTDETGKEKVEFYEEPDWTERRQSAVKVLEIHGSFAPVAVDVNVHNDLDRLTDAELNKRLAAATLAYHEAKEAHERTTAVAGQEPIGIAAAGADGAVLDSGPVLLADECDLL